MDLSLCLAHDFSTSMSNLLKVFSQMYRIFSLIKVSFTNNYFKNQIGPVFYSPSDNMKSLVNGRANNLYAEEKVEMWSGQYIHYIPSLHENVGDCR